MADFETNLVTIAKGRFGKDVREAIYDTIKELYTVGSGYTPTSKSPLIDTSDGNIKGIRVRAHSTQNGTPAPNNPVDIVDASKVITTHNGSETDYKSSSITLNAVVFASVDDVADEIVIDAKTRRGIFYKRVTRNTFKNSITEKWREYISATNQIFILETPNPKPDYTKHIYSDRFVYGIPAPLITTGGKIYCAPTDEVWLVFPANTFTNIDAFKSWLETNNVVVEYALKNPSERILSEEQVDEILSLKTFEGTTYVDAETDVEITYSIGWKTYIDNADAEINERIDELASNPSSSLVLTNPSPLPCTDGKKILGIDAMGRSWQGTNYLEQGGIGHTTNANYSANKVDGTARVRIAELIPTVSGQTYTITCNSGYMVIVQSFNASGLLVDTSGSNAWNNPLTVTASEYMGVAIRKSDNSNISIAEAKSANILVNGSPIFAPTPSNPIPITDADPEVTAIGKNLFDKERCVNGYLDGNGNVVSNPQYRVSDYIEVEHSQITISGNKGGNEVICFFAEDKTRVSFFAMGSNNIKTLDVPQNAKFVRCTVSADNLNIYQVEIGATATSYVPYQSNSVLLPFEPKSVETAANELIVYEDGTGKIIQRVGTMTTADFKYYVSNGGTNSNRCVLNTDNVFLDKTQIAMCDGFVFVSGGNTAIGNDDRVGIFAFRDDQKGFTFRIDKSISTADDVKNYFKEKAFTIYYPLPTPIETPLTAEEVAAVRQLMTYKGTTIIESEMEIKSVTYPGDVKAYVDSKTDYSYTDQIIGKWADGKDLHRMVIQTTTPSGTNMAVVFPLLKSGDVDVKIFGGTVYASSSAKIPINIYINSTNSCSCWIDTNGIYMTSTYSSKPCEIIVEYTLKDSAPAAASVLSLDEEGDE